MANDSSIQLYDFSDIDLAGAEFPPFQANDPRVVRKPNGPPDFEHPRGAGTGGLFDQASGAIDQIAEDAKMQSATAIQRRAEQGEREASAAFAAIGGGRSGFAGETFAGIQIGAIDATANAEANIERERLLQQAVLKRREAELEFEKALTIAGWAEQDRQNAKAFDRMLWQMRVGHELGMEMAAFQHDLDVQFEKETGGGWGAAFGEFLGFAGDAVALVQELT